MTSADHALDVSGVLNAPEFRGTTAAPTPRAPRPPAPAATDAAAVLARRHALPPGVWRTGVLAAAAWLALGLLTLLWPNKPIGFSDWNFTEEFGYATLVIAAVFLVIALLGPRAGRLARTLRPAGQWLVASALVLALWELSLIHI